MAKNKTTETKVKVLDFINAITNEKKRKDGLVLLKLFKKHTGMPAKMWGPSIIGFGKYHYKYPSGHEGDAPIAAFSPRSTALTFYFSSNFEKREELLAMLGKHKISKACIYVNKLEDINIAVLEKMIVNDLKHMKKLYPLA
jgi:hypothetical protein